MKKSEFNKGGNKKMTEENFLDKVLNGLGEYLDSVSYGVGLLSFLLMMILLLPIFVIVFPFWVLGLFFKRILEEAENDK